MSLIADVTMKSGELFDINFGDYENEDSTDVNVPYVRRYDKNGKMVKSTYFHGYEADAKICLDAIKRHGDIDHINWIDEEHKVA